MLITNSPVSQFAINNRTIYVKRDDLLNPEFNGNKARKLAYYLYTPLPYVDTLIGYGGAQSNLMYSLSYLAKLKHWQFIYYVKTLSKGAINSTTGNLAASLTNGMQIVPVGKEFDSFVKDLSARNNELIIHQGAAQAEAEFGLATLAREIRAWAIINQIKDLSIFVPSGTGTTALLLHKHLPEFGVYTTNCIGSPEYLQQQMQQLLSQNNLPQIFENRRYRFGNPHQDLLATSAKISQLSNIEFDMLYDPVGWTILLANLNKTPTQALLYIHCGGTFGNQTMLNRYIRSRHKNII